MPQCRYLPIVSIFVTIILTVGEASGQGIRNCEEGEICMKKNECPEYLTFLSSAGQAKRIEGERLRGNICNKKTDKLCCKICLEEEICMDKNECPDYSKFKYLSGRSKTIEGERVRGKICNTKPDKLCCKPKTKTVPHTSTRTTTKNQSPNTCMQRGQSYPKSFLPAADQCGVSCSGTKSVVHGENAVLGEFPWAALLGTERILKQWDNRRKKWVNKSEKLYHCGGTLINTWYVLTAAQCQTEKYCRSCSW